MNDDEKVKIEFNLYEIDLIRNALDRQLGDSNENDFQRNAISFLIDKIKRNVKRVCGFDLPDRENGEYVLTDAEIKNIGLECAEIEKTLKVKGVK